MSATGALGPLHRPYPDPHRTERRRAPRPAREFVLIELRSDPRKTDGRAVTAR